jgi:hypothetical protein
MPIFIVILTTIRCHPSLAQMTSRSHHPGSAAEMAGGATMTLTDVLSRGLKHGCRNRVAVDVVGPCHDRSGRYCESARNQMQISALSRTEHQSVRPQGHLFAEAICCFVMDFQRDQRKLQSRGHNTRPEHSIKSTGPEGRWVANSLDRGGRRPPLHAD